MNIETELVKKKEFSTSINSGIQKHSQEYKVLAILRYLYPQKFSTMINGEAPDLQDNENGVGIEVDLLQIPYRVLIKIHSHVRFLLCRCPFDPRGSFPLAPVRSFLNRFVCAI